MGKAGHLPIAPHVEEEAAAWVARLDTSPLDATESAAFAAWLAGSPAHKAAFERYEGLWAEFDQLAGAPRPPMPAASANDAAARSPSWHMLAASVALLLLVGGFFLVRSPWNSASEPVYATQIGEQRAVTLVDNSRITLNTDTSIRQVFSEHERRLELQRGEALFEISADSSRPFVVFTPAGTVTAIGTKFVVRITEDGQLNVLVTEGRVVVAPSVAAGAVRAPRDHQSLSAGEELRIDTERTMRSRIDTEEASRALAWRQGDIVFSGVPLSSAAAEMQRYSNIRIHVDPAAAHFSVGGYFRTNNVEAFLQTIEQAFPVRVERERDEVRVIARANPEFF